jgi:hypothetical protein
MMQAGLDANGRALIIPCHAGGGHWVDYDDHEQALAAEQQKRREAEERAKRLQRVIDDAMAVGGEEAKSEHRLLEDILRGEDQ